MQDKKARFRCGQLCATPAALDKVGRAGLIRLLERHLSGDWGDRMVFQTIYQKLTQQVEEVQSDRIQIHNERYRLTKKDVRSNLERCLDMVKARFPDKEPLIQEMIRSIR